MTFCSYASNLVANDTNVDFDIFVKDTETGATTLVSSNSAGVRGNGGSYLPSISADGRYLAFWSGANNFVSGDTNNTVDAFLKDTLTGSIIRVSTDSSGGQGSGIWAGTWVGGPVISADSGFVAFPSSFSNLVSGDINEKVDVFLKETGLSIQMCTPAPPNLTFSMEYAFWASYGDYMAGSLSVKYTISNLGPDSAYNVNITGSTATGGVTLATATPISLGTVSASGSVTRILTYNVASGINIFQAMVYASAQDACGVSYM